MVQGGFSSKAAERGSEFERKHCTPNVRLFRERKCELNADTPTIMV